MDWRTVVQRLAKSIVAACALSIATTAAMGQTEATPEIPQTADSGGLAEIVVTAQKREQNVQSVPLSVQVIGQAQLSAAGIEPTISKSPEEFGAFIKSQAEVREKVIKAVGMKID